MRSCFSVLVLCLVFTAGCASSWPHPANVYQMTLPLEETARFNGNTPLAGKVALGAVATAGDRDLMGSGTDARIAEFREALQRSLDDAKLAAEEESAFMLHATVTRINASLTSDTFTVIVTYALVRAADGATVLRDAVSTSHTSTTDDTKQAGYRQVLAINGAFQKNITKAIELLYRDGGR